MPDRVTADGRVSVWVVSLVQTRKRGRDVVKRERERDTLWRESLILHDFMNIRLASERVKRLKLYCQTFCCNVYPIVVALILSCSDH